MTPIFDSRDARYKTPFGAVPAGTQVTFRISLPKDHLGSEPVLNIFEMDRWEAPAVVLLALDEADLVNNWYTCTYTPERPALLGYHFEVMLEDGLHTVRRGGDGLGCLDEGENWQLTVYDPGMRCPSFLQEGVMYQIFPDRFCNSGTPKEDVPADRVLRGDWEGLPHWRPDEHGEVRNNDYFGGDLEGIIGKLDYLQGMGVTVLYLNPVFEAHSNHRYNTADYRKIDPLLGTNSDLERLCREAKLRGISVILDGVFSHTGSDSVYFNKNRRYGSGGAYNDPQSPYSSWYIFHHYPDDYECWWGFPTLPNVREQDPGYLEFICGEDGVLRHWLRKGVAGFRLDVADELPDEFLDALHDSVKGYGSGCAVLGEVWEDASNKVSYGVRRRYLLGKQLDSVMNYPFKEAVLRYVRYGDAPGLYGTIMRILENYPAPAIQGLMNFLSTHDTARAITELAGHPVGEYDRYWQEQNHFLSLEEYERGCRLFALATIIQFGLPGIPCIYYGDEAGICGYKDPFNRTCFPWGKENSHLTGLISSLGALRREQPVFGQAGFLPLIFGRDMCCFARHTPDKYIVFAVNRSEGYRRVRIPRKAGEVVPAVVWGIYEDNMLGPLSGVVLMINKTN